MRPVAFGLMLYAALLMGACATKPQTAPVVVEKAVWPPCPTDVPATPIFVWDTLTGNEDIFTKGMALYADRKARQAYELALATRLQGCVSQTPPEGGKIK